MKLISVPLSTTQNKVRVCMLLRVCVCVGKSEKETPRARLHCISVLSMHVYDMTNPRIPQVFPIPSYRDDLASTSPLSPFTISPYRIKKKKKHSPSNLTSSADFYSYGSFNWFS